MKPRAVLDSNVLIGNRNDILLLLAATRAYTLVTSAYIVSEVVRVRTEIACERGEDFAVNRVRLNRLIWRLCECSVMVNYTRISGGTYPWLEDRDDEPIIATALVGKAQYIVTEDKKLIPPPELNPYPTAANPLFAGVLFVKTEDFITRLKRGIA